MDTSKVEDILGSRFTTYPLKPESSVALNAIRKADIRQPTVNLLVTDDKKRFKIHEVDSIGNVHIQRILRMKENFSKIYFVPKIVYADELTIIVEYVDGEFPSFSSDDFTSKFAKNLAFLHGVDVSHIDANQYLDGVESDVDYLTSHWKLRAKVAKKLINKIGSMAPSKIQTSMAYADLTPQNFIVTPSGELYFIDLGGFQQGVVTDQCFLSHSMYSAIHQGLFKSTYLDEGGSSYLFDYGDFLLTVSNVTRVVAHMKSLKNIPLKQWRKKRSRKKAINRMIADLKVSVG